MVLISVFYLASFTGLLRSTMFEIPADRWMCVQDRFACRRGQTPSMMFFLVGRRVEIIMLILWIFWYVLMMDYGVWCFSVDIQSGPTKRVHINVLFLFRIENKTAWAGQSYF